MTDHSRIKFHRGGGLKHSHKQAHHSGVKGPAGLCKFPCKQIRETASNSKRHMIGSSTELSVSIAQESLKLWRS